MSNPERTCSFCGKQLAEAERLIVSADAAICVYCTVMNYLILEKEGVDLVRISEKAKHDLAKSGDAAR